MTDPSPKNRLMKSIPNVLLADINLRPSSLQWWHQKGVRSTMEVQQGLQVHSDGSIIQWAQDLNAKSAGFLARLYQEVQSSLEEYMDTRPYPSNSEWAFIRTQSAAELLNERKAEGQWGNPTVPQKSTVVTFSQSVDALFGGGIPHEGGIPVGELTEIVGPPGIGKTQFGMQLALNVQIPVEFGGLAGSAIYIDTEGSLAPERCYEMATHLFRHVVHKDSNRRREAPMQARKSLPDWFTPEGLLAGIAVLRIHDVATLDAAIASLEKLCRDAQRPVRMIIVDSLAFPVRAESTNDFVGRTQQLTQWAMKLSQIAQSQPRRAVVVLNQMTTTTNQTSSTAAPANKENSLIVGTMLTPALGEAWAHAVTNRVILAFGLGDRRIFRLVKSPRLPSGQAEYTVVEAGIRDVDRHRGRLACAT